MKPPVELRHASANSSSRKRTLQEIRSSGEDSDSDIEILPCKVQRNTLIRDDSTIKARLLHFLEWMKPMSSFQNFMSSALKSLGYYSVIDDDLEVNEMSPRKKFHNDSLVPRPGRLERLDHFGRRNKYFNNAGNDSSKENMPHLVTDGLSKATQSNPNTAPGRWLAPYFRNHSSELSFTMDSSSNQSQRPPDTSNGAASQSVKKVSNALKLLDSSEVFTHKGRLPLRHRRSIPDIQFLRESLPTEVLASRTKLVLPYAASNVQPTVAAENKMPLSSSSNGTKAFTTNEVVNKHEKDMYKMLLETYFVDGCWQPKAIDIPFQNVETRVDLDSDLMSPKRAELSDYLEMYQKKHQLVKKSDVPKPKIVMPIFKPTPPEEVLLLDNDEPFIFKEKEGKPLSLPKVEGSSFFTLEWIQQLKKTVDEETEERLKIVEEQKRQIKQVQKKRLQKLSLLSGESLSVDKDADFPELTPEMDCVIDEALVPHPSNEVLTQFNQQPFLRKDMETLNNKAWLNDEVINFYLLLIVERSKLPEYPTVYAFTSFFYSNLKARGYPSIKRWTRKINVFAFEVILVPLHLGFHWCLAVIDFRNKSIKYYDSMAGKENCLEILRHYIAAESKDKRKKDFDFTGWVFEIMKDIPQQMNGFDCGMFTLKYAEYVTRDAKFTFSQQNMQYFRRKMVYEIITQKII